MAELTLHKNQFIFKCNFEERLLAKDAGFRWDSVKKFWYTPSMVVAAKLRQFGNDEVKSKINSSLLSITPWTQPLPPPPLGLTIMPHQEIAIRFALERTNSYLALDPRLGKTICAAMLLRSFILSRTPGETAVYICPPFLVQNVKEEFDKWCPEYPITIIPDSTLSREKNAIPFPGFRFVFIDEAHRFKNDTAKRTKALFGDTKTAGLLTPFKKKIFMSGTPMPNRPMELFPVLSYCAPELIDHMNKFQYGRRYCAGYQNDWGWDFSGASNLGELKQRIEPFMLRQRREDVLDLPPKVEEVFTVSADMSPRLSEMNKDLGRRYGTIEDLIKHRLALSTGKDVAEELHTSSYRRLLGREKIKPAVELIESILDETNENLLVFAYHKEVIELLVNHLKSHRPIVITGDTPVGDRQSLVKTYQRNQSHKLLIGNYLALGVGFTIPKADRVIFVEYDWVPGNNEQASDRAVHMDKKTSVLVQYICYKDSLDKAVIETLLRKRKAIGQI